MVVPLLCMERATSELAIIQHYKSSETIPLREERPSILNGSNHWILRQLAKVNQKTNSRPGDHSPIDGNL